MSGMFSRLCVRAGWLLPVAMVLALVAAPFLHEAAHDHRHDGVESHAASGACGHTGDFTESNAPGIPADQDEQPAPGDCWLCIQLHAPAIPPTPTAVVCDADTAPTTLAPITRRVTFGGFDHSITPRGPPIALDLA